jgi:hypothetical protein
MANNTDVVCLRCQSTREDLCDICVKCECDCRCEPQPLCLGDEEEGNVGDGENCHHGVGYDEECAECEAELLDEAEDEELDDEGEK